MLLPDHKEIYAFTRALQTERLLVILNFTEAAPVFELPPQVSFTDKELLLSNYAVDAGEDIHQLTLRPFEARVYRLS